MKHVLFSIFLITLSFLAKGQTMNLDYSFNPTCNGGNNGGLCVITSGFLGTTNYTLTPGGVTNTTGCFNYLGVGTYTVSASDSFSNTASTVVSLNAPTAFSLTLNPVACSPLVNIATMGGTSPYTVISSPGGYYDPIAQTMQLYSGNGTYTITAIDANGCSVTSSYSLNYNPPTISVTRTFPNTNCTSSVFNICENASGGAPPYSYTMNGITNTSGCFSGINFGNQIVEITDANGCVHNDTLSITNVMLYNTVTSPPSSCNSSNGSICIDNLQMASLPVTYTINGGTPQTNNCFTGLSSGTYTISIADAGSCTDVLTVTLYGPSINGYANVSNSSCGTNTGSICINAVWGGTPPYTYSINGGTPQSSNCFTNLATGQYTNTIQDAGGCMKDIISMVENPSFLNFPNITDASCAGNPGSASITAFGSFTPPITFTLLPGNISNTTGLFNNLTAGNYTINALDGAGCFDSESFFVSTNSYLGSLPFTSSPGSVTLSSNGLTPPITFTFDNISSTSNTFTGFCSGSYFVGAVDANGCIKQNYINLTSMSNFPGTTINANLTDQYCPASNTGSIDIIITPSGSYQYEMASPLYINNGTNPNFANLNAGPYNFNIYDGSNNCVSKTYTLNTLNNVCGVVTGKVYLDDNLNCIDDPGEMNLKNEIVILAPGNHITYTNPLGQYQFYNKSFNAYNLFQLPSTYFTPSNNCGTVFPIILNTGNTTEYREFADSMYNNFVDVGAHINNTYFVTGFNSTFKIPYQSNHPYSPADGVITLNLDPDLNFVSSIPAPSSVSGNTITWNYANLLNNTLFPPFIEVEVQTPVTSLINTPIDNCVNITTTNVADINLSNNNYCMNTVVVSSFDPNNIIVSPKGAGNSGLIAKTDSILTYTINFQNTGTFTAQKVVLVDSLPKELSLRKFKVLDYSHMYELNIDTNGVLTVTFNNIMLPDSNTNEPGSHGYITYQIHQKSNLLPGQTIENQAFIYFDYNPPIATNTTLNTIISPTDLGNPIVKETFKISPVPCNDVLHLTSSLPINGQIQIIDIEGRVVKTITSNHENNISIPTHTLNNGLYILQVTDNNHKTSKKFTVQH